MTFRSVWYGALGVDRAGDSGLDSAGDELVERSLSVVPRLTNQLADSAEVSTRDGETVVSYTSPYAVKQHEDTTYRHQSGQQAKFLEDPLDQGHRDLLGKIAGELRKAMPRTRL